MPHHCAIGCKATDVVMHVFPNPKKYRERFKVWVSLAGEDCQMLSDDEIYKKKRICDLHFTDNHRNRFKRLNAMAVPSLHLPNSSRAQEPMAAIEVDPMVSLSVVPDQEIGAITEDDLTITEVVIEAKKEELSTKNAVSFLLSGTLTSKVCRYCLEVTEELNSLEKIVEIGSKSGVYSVAVKDMVASFHPFQVQEDPNFPNQICNKCVDCTINSYLFTQQCEQSERALRNCFEDIYTKFSKLDPLEGKKHSRGRKKIYVNYNRITAEHAKVIDYADPIYHIVNADSDCVTTQPEAPISQLECLKCCRTLPDTESLVNHSKTHPKSMWYNCRLCGKSFPKIFQLKRHFKEHLKVSNREEEKFECKTCSETNEKYYKHIQHLEKHKFKMVLDHLVHRRMDRLCSICLDKGDLVSLNKMVTIHGGPPDLMGMRTMQSILASTVPELDFQDNYTGSKICQNCVNNAITSYNFKNHTYFVRDRLNTCIGHMLDSLKDISGDSNLCIEISKDIIMPINDDVDETMFEEDETKQEVLEDEYRIKSDEESDEIETKPMKRKDLEYRKHNKISKLKGVYINGYQNDLCSEFLAFNDKKKRKTIKKLTCPICNKHYLSDYFLKRHITKHINQKLYCEPCGTVFGNKFSLLEHEKYAHVLYHSDYKACKTCGRGFTKESKLLHHEEQHKNKPCLLCNKVFKTQGFFNAHMQRHTTKLSELKNKYEQSCSFCEKVCSNDNQLSIHVNKVHLQIKPYNCDMCDKQYYTEYNLRFHKKIHSRKSKENCMFCSKTLKSRKQLVIHIRKHIGATPHTCQMCNESYYSVTRLKKHMSLTHGGTVICKICKHIFVSKSELKIHVNRAHSIL